MTGLAPEQEPGAEVSEHGDLGMLKGGDNAGSHGLLVLRQSVVDGGHDIVERLEDGILEIQFPSREDVNFRTSEDATTELSALVEFANGLDLAVGEEQSGATSAE